ncbi:MAG: hypothetical protein ACRD1X_14565 [Vicinamibacteria bacterium]
MDDETKRFMEQNQHALEETKKSVDQGVGRLEGKIDSYGKELHQHTIESAVRYAQVDQRARSAHHRIDDHLKDHEKKSSISVAVWIAVATSAAGTITAIIVAVMSK